MEICSISIREFKIGVLKILNKRQENAFRKQINEQNQYFIEETETLKKNPKNSGDEELSKRDQE